MSGYWLLACSVWILCGRHSNQHLYHDSHLRTHSKDYHTLVWTLVELCIIQNNKCPLALGDTAQWLAFSDGESQDFFFGLCQALTQQNVQLPTRHEVYHFLYYRHHLFRRICAPRSHYCDILIDIAPLIMNFAVKYSRICIRCQSWWTSDPLKSY